VWCQQGSPLIQSHTSAAGVHTARPPACLVCLPPVLPAARGKGSKQESPQASRTPSEEASLANSRHTYASTEGKPERKHPHCSRHARHLKLPVAACCCLSWAIPAPRLPLLNRLLFWLPLCLQRTSLQCMQQMAQQ
jgi:hypothetical protein